MTKHFLRAFVVAVVLILSFGASFDLAVAAQEKTVHVKEYTRKDGTRVKAHDRKAPDKKGTASAPSPATTAATQPRDEKGRFVRSDTEKDRFMRQTSRSAAITS